MTTEVDFRPVAGALGAEVRGLDLAAVLCDGTIDRLKQGLGEHLVLFFRDQDMTPEQLLAFSRRFGDLMICPYIGHHPDHPEIIAVLKEAEEARISVFGGDWHSDFSFLEEPPLGSILQALQVPPSGGDTLWANMILAHEALSDGMKALLAGLSAAHSGHVYGAQRPPTATLRTSSSIEISRHNPEADRERAHPVVRRHLPSGRPALFVNRIYTTRFAGMSEAESAPLLNFLYEHATRPEFTCRWSWRAGDVAFWDNRATLHYAINDYDGQRRLLHRTTIAGEAPQAAV